MDNNFKGIRILDSAERQEMAARAGEVMSNFSAMDMLGRERFEARVQEKLLTGEPILIGAIGCMPKLITGVDSEGTPSFRYDSSGLKSTIDYRANRFVALQAALEAVAPTRMQCLIADEIQVLKTGGYLNLTAEQNLAKAQKVIKRVRRVFPGEVGLVSQYMPVGEEAFEKLFRGAYSNAIDEVEELGGIVGDPYGLQVYRELCELGADKDVAEATAMDFVASRIAYYGVEGRLLISERSGWDAYVAIANSATDFATDTIRLLGPKAEERISMIYIP